MSKKKHILAIFEFAPSIPKLIADVKALKVKVTTAPGNTRILLDPAKVNAWQGHIDDLDAAEALVKQKGEGYAADRDLALETVKTDTRLVVANVQAAADLAPDEVTAKAIIEDCGCRVRRVAVRAKPEVDAKNVKGESGTLLLISKAVKPKFRPSYEWQKSLDGTNFATFKTTPYARIKWVSGLEPGTKVWVRKRVITNKDVGDPTWSTAVSVIVL